MCGFSTYFLFDSATRKPSLADLDASLEQIRHRGPDSDGKYISSDGRCGLGHVRLSINDLKGGHQPIANPANNIFTVVNGELYGYQEIRNQFEANGYVFKTKSDSELVLPLYQKYGMSFLDYLRGEFAFCLYDSKKSHFIAARDRFGIKPLFYTVQDGVLLVASEMKAFLTMGWNPEWDMDSIVHNGSMLDYRTCFKNVHKLPPAHYLVADSNGRVEIKRYWNPEYPNKLEKDPRSLDEMIQGVRHRLEESVRLRLEADVPVGIYLSGGIDSSCVAGIASKILKETNPDAKLKAFSVCFKNGGKFDESEIAERTAKFVDADFEKVDVTEEDILENVESCVWYNELSLPSLNCVGKYMLSKAARNSGYKTVITGEGSDEHFAGYSFFSYDFLSEPDHTTSINMVSETTRKEVSKKYDDIFSTGINNYGIKGNNKAAYAMFTGYASPNQVFYSKNILSDFGAPNYISTPINALENVNDKNISKNWHALHNSLFIYSRVYLGNCFCSTLGDRVEMANSIEGRVPFLDHHFCEYVNSLPPSVKVKIENDGSVCEKWILKEAVKPYVTKEIYERTKQPFLAPQYEKASKGKIDFVNKWITEENVNRLGWADFDLVNTAKQQLLKTQDIQLFDNLTSFICYIILSHQFNIAKYSNNNPTLINSI